MLLVRLSANSILLITKFWRVKSYILVWYRSEFLTGQGLTVPQIPLYSIYKGLFFVHGRCPTQVTGGTISYSHSGTQGIRVTNILCLPQPKYVTFLGKRDWRIKHDFTPDLTLIWYTLLFLRPCWIELVTWPCLDRRGWDVQVSLCLEPKEKWMTLAICIITYTTVRLS